MEKMPSAAKYSDRSRARDASHTVSPDTEYRAISNPDQVVTPEDRVKAYRVCCLHAGFSWHQLENALFPYGMQATQTYA